MNPAFLSETNGYNKTNDCEISIVTQSVSQSTLLETAQCYFYLRSLDDLG